MLDMPNQTIFRHLGWLFMSLTIGYFVPFAASAFTAATSTRIPTDLILMAQLAFVIFAIGRAILIVRVMLSRLDKQ